MQNFKVFYVYIKIGGENWNLFSFILMELFVL